MASDAENPSVVFSVRGVEKRFGDRVVLRGADLEVRQGECVVILGKSGAGKSVLMRMLLGFMTPNAGRIRVFGELPPFSPYRQEPTQIGRLNALFQDGALLQDHTVAENMEIAVASRAKGAAGNRSEQSAQLIEQAGLDWNTVAGLAPAKLSGGMCKRVALARALASDPEALLIDEPTAGLDVHSSARIVQLLKETLRGKDLTAIVITHDLDCVEALAERLFFLSAKTGQLEEIDPRQTDREALAARMDEDDPPIPTPGKQESSKGLPEIRRAVMDLLENVGSCLRSAGSAAAIPHPGDFTKRFMQVGIHSLPLAAIVFFILGMILLVESRMALSHLGMYNLLPEVLLESGMKISPFLVGLILAGRVGSSICAEMSLLRQTGQLDAMRVLGLVPERRLLAPWLWSALAAFPLLVLASQAIAGLGAAALIGLPFAGSEITPRYFWSEVFEKMDLLRLFIGMVKASIFGAVIVMTAYLLGEREQQGAGAAGKSITTAMVVSFVLIIALDFLISLSTSTL